MYSSRTYFITGLTGYIGKLITKELLRSPEYQEGQIDIIGLVRHPEKIGEVIGRVPDAHFTWIEGDCRDDFWKSTKLEERLGKPVDYIIHCAAPTSSSYMISNPVETADSIVSGTRNVLELARRLRPKSMVFLSSMEVYGCVPDFGRPRSESELGEISLDAARSCYPLGKRMAEHYCHIYQKEYGIPVKIARLAQTFGRGVLPADHRVYMQFAKAVIEQKDIVLQTSGLSMGNYCAAEDAVSAILLILKKGSNGEAYNVVNEAETRSIREMAELVANQVAQGRIGVKIREEDILKTGYAPHTLLRISGEKLRRLGWRPTKGLVEMYRDMIEELQ